MIHPDIAYQRYLAARDALKSQGSVRRAAAYLGIPASTFQHWMAKAPATEPVALETHPIPHGQTIRGESIRFNAAGEVTSRLVRTATDTNPQRWIEGLKEAFQDYKGRAPAIPQPDGGDADLLTVYPLPDLHIGMYSWLPETGANYDLQIAIRTVIDAVTRLVEQSRPSRQAVVLGLGDYLHSNDYKAETPGSGHRLDVDGRWPKVFKAAAQLATQVIDIVARKHPEVEVVFLPGNHDQDASVALTVALSFFYDKSEHIKVDETPAIAWFKRFGTTLLGATHGHTVKTPEKAAMMMAVDRAEDWGKTKHRHIFTGHIHHETAKEVAGVRVESFQAPAARDSYNASHGYRAGRSLSALTFHIEGGEIGRHKVNIT